jgi:catechol 2,3-dioxygenase
MTEAHTTGEGTVTAADTAGSTGTEHPIAPQEIGHVVLRVRSLERSTPFYELLGFRKVAEVPGQMAFFTATGANHHDLALQQVGEGAPAQPPFGVGLYHIAIRLPSDDHVRRAFRVLTDAGVELVGTADHAVSHSLYLKDPDGIEIELYADVPEWQELEDQLSTTFWDPR